MNRFAGQIDMTSYLEGSPQWELTNRAASDGRQARELTNVKAETDSFNSGIAGIAKKRAAKYGADASMAAAKAEASATVSNAVSSTIGDVFSSGIGAYGRANNLGKYAREEDDDE